MISYNQIVGLIKGFADNHDEIKRFSAEFREQMPNITTDGIEFPYLFLVPVGTSTGEFVKEIEVDVYCIDRLRKDRLNVNDVVSDTEQILTDLAVWLEDGQESIGVLKQYTATPINNDTLDYVGGWVQKYRLELERIAECEIPMTGVDPPSVVCDDAEWVLKDADGNILDSGVIASGASGDIEAPDASYVVEYVNGTPIESGFILSGGSKLIQVPNPSCDDATININGVLWDTVEAGATENIKVLQSNGMTEVGSKQGVNWRIADSDISLNGGAFLSVKAEDSQDISLVDQDDFDITPISVIGNVIKVDIPVAVANLTTLVTGQTTVSIAGDDGTTQYGREDSFLVLSEDNPHGNTARFTDKLGGSTYAEGVAFDWAYRDEVNQLVIGWQIADNGVDVNFADAVAYCNGLTLDTYSNWFIPNENLLHTLKNTQTTRALNYPPFNDSSNRGFWSGTSLLGVLPTYAECLPNRSYAQLCAIVKTTVANMRVRACRIYTYAEAGA